MKNERRVQYHQYTGCIHSHAHRGKDEEPFRIVVPICRIGGLNEADKLIPMKQSPKVSLLTSNFIPRAAASSTRKSGHLLARFGERWFLPEG